MVKNKNRPLSMTNVTQDVGAVRFPIGPDGKISIMGKRAAPGMDRDIAQFVKKGKR